MSKALKMYRRRKQIDEHIICSMDDIAWAEATARFKQLLDQVEEVEILPCPEPRHRLH